MELNAKQKKLIEDIDRKVRLILSYQGSDEFILAELADDMPALKEIVDGMCQKKYKIDFMKYDGFYRYIKILENLAQKIASGEIKVPP